MDNLEGQHIRGGVPFDGQGNISAHRHAKLQLLDLQLWDLDRFVTARLGDVHQPSKEGLQRVLEIGEVGRSP
jgi:hypothetical protein